MSRQWWEPFGPPIHAPRMETREDVMRRLDLPEVVEQFWQGFGRRLVQCKYDEAWIESQRRVVWDKKPMPDCRVWYPSGYD